MNNRYGRAGERRLRGAHPFGGVDVARRQACPLNRREDAQIACPSGQEDSSRRPVRILQEGRRTYRMDECTRPAGGCGEESPWRMERLRAAN
jgi:hypothetical protein